MRIARSEITARFAGSILRAGWAIATPVLMLMIYAAVYLLIFSVQVPGKTGASYVVLIFTGLVPFLTTSEALSTGVSSVVANRAVLADTVFPIDLVPIKSVVLAQVTMLAGLGSSWKRRWCSASSGRRCFCSRSSGCCMSCSWSACSGCSR
ncbi:hypothetical protein [Bosea sp. FBZP-16]|uniref:ABC transporter permease n=1 Tax=Bosea sp. FBZP-16 TaxID=2065382 RepID=UPI000C30A0F4|nr:hypothetical protein [Bosea sp. FBZP-16]